MKKILLLAIAFMAATFIFAQPGFNPKILSGEVMDKLTPALVLTAEQKPNVTEAVSGFLNKKSGIISLQKTDAPVYMSKLNVLSGDLINQLKEIFTAKQMSSFLGLKPRVNTPSNVLSQLFF